MKGKDEIQSLFDHVLSKRLNQGDGISSVEWEGVSARIGRGLSGSFHTPETSLDGPLPRDLSYHLGDASMSAREKGGCLLSPEVVG